jgi:hypothetical protein
MYRTAEIFYNLDWSSLGAMPVSENETAISRGRIPTYLRRQQIHLTTSLLLSHRQNFAESQLELLRNNSTVNSFEIGFFNQCNRRQRRQLLRDMMAMFYYHHSSYVL